MTVTQHADERAHPEIRNWTLWYSIVAGIVAWAARLSMSHALVSNSCERGWLTGSILGIDALQFTLLMISAVALIFVIAAGILSYGNWNRLRADDATPTTPDRNRYVFMSVSGLASSVMFGALIVFEFLPSLIIPPCQ